MMTEERTEQPVREAMGLTARGSQIDIPAVAGPAALACPVCGRENAPDAVFCSNSACHKSLGEFRYVLEEMRAEAAWHETLAEKVTAFIGRPQFLVVHALWFGVWVALNTGFVMLLRPFDAYPFGLLGIILSVEAILITGFILISNNRQSEHADKRAELDYEVNVRTYRAINAIDSKLQRILGQLERLDTGR